MRRWLSVLVVLLIIARFSSQPFAGQDLRPEIERRGRLVQAVREMPPVRFSYDGQAVDSRLDPADFVQFWLRKGAHIFIYGLLGLALAGALKARGLKGFGRWAAAAALVAAVAVLDEWNQQSVPGRTGRAADVFLDLAGFLFLGLAREACRLPLRLIRKKA
ncbi:MAG: VanZ family protein [Peptococcaceae bacterium]|nr:VanZ family protein [Peptococcaceae bacterium]